MVAGCFVMSPTASAAAARAFTRALWLRAFASRIDCALRHIFATPWRGGASTINLPDCRARHIGDISISALVASLIHLR